MKLAYAAAALLVSATVAHAADPVLMSAEWGTAACAAWNADPVLTKDLVESGWIENDEGRGFKVMQVYREDCGDKPTAELRVSLKDGTAHCVYGGAVQTAKLESGADYVMFAETKRWQEMGRGEYGPMKAMAFGRLGFKGPKMEAMGNMGPFSNFLLLVGKVQSDAGSCPK
jgi:putative sterol carrier protein